MVAAVVVAETAEHHSTTVAGAGITPRGFRPTAAIHIGLLRMPTTLQGRWSAPRLQDFPSLR